MFNRVDDGETPGWRANQRTLHAVPRYGKIRWSIALLTLAALPVFVLFWGFMTLILWGIGSTLLTGNP
jgi:hypothetical protein